MFLLGKLTFAIIGLKLFGFLGFMWGFCLGHLFIDRTVVSKYISSALNTMDDNIRLILPYNSYSFYDRIISPLFGKAWGLVLGFSTYGLFGAIALSVIGHYAFDKSNNEKFEDSKTTLNDYVSKLIFLLCGLTIGFTFQTREMIFIFGFFGLFIDAFRSRRGLISGLKINKVTPFWPRLNIIKLYLGSPEARKTALIKSVAGLAAIISKADGGTSNNELRAFKRIFNISSRDAKIMQIFNYALESDINHSYFSRQIYFIAKNNIEVKEDVIDSLFQIAIADGSIKIGELEVLKQVAEQIELPEGNFEAIRSRYAKIEACAIKDEVDYYKVLGASCNMPNEEIRQLWKKLTTKYHPDKIASRGGSKEEIEHSSYQMAEINYAYQQIMKHRKRA